MTNHMTDFFSATNHAAVQSDRWLLIAVCLMGMGAATFLWRWIVSDYVRRVEQMMEVIATNTAALAAVKEVIGHCRIKHPRQEKHWEDQTNEHPTHHGLTAL